MDHLKKVEKVTVSKDRFPFDDILSNGNYKVQFNANEIDMPIESRKIVAILPPNSPEIENTMPYADYIKAILDAKQDSCDNYRHDERDPAMCHDICHSRTIESIIHPLQYSVSSVIIIN